MVDEEIRCLMEDGKQIIEENTNNTVETAKKLLGQKYGLDFEVLAIGNRLDRETADLIVVAEDDPDRCFKAVVNNDIPKCSDNYVRRCVGIRLRDELVGMLKENGAEAYCIVKLLSEDDSDETDTEISIEEYFERYQVSGMLIYMMAPSSQEGGSPTPQTIKAACDALHDRYRVTVTLWCYYIIGDYEKCKQGFLRNPDVGAGYFDFFETEPAFSYAAKYDVR